MGVRRSRVPLVDLIDAMHMTISNRPKLLDLNIFGGCDAHVIELQLTKEKKVINAYNDKIIAMFFGRKCEYKISHVLKLQALGSRF